MENQRIASHPGIVSLVANRRVSVRIQAISACASCSAHGRCGFADSKEKTIEVPSDDWQNYSVGDPVIVHIDENRGMQAVWLAYVLPAILLLSVIVGLSLLQIPEWAVVLAAFATLGLYILILYLRRRKVEGRFTLTIEQGAVGRGECAVDSEEDSETSATHAPLNTKR